VPIVESTSLLCGAGRMMKLQLESIFHEGIFARDLHLVHRPFPHKKTYKIQHLVQIKKIIHNKLTMSFLLAKISIAIKNRLMLFPLRTYHAR